MTPAEWLATRRRFDGDVPTTREEAVCLFNCGLLNMTLRGPACAKRHRQTIAEAEYEDQRSAATVAKHGRIYFGEAHTACLTCKAGAARAELLGVDPIEDYTLPAWHRPRCGLINEFDKSAVAHAVAAIVED